MFPEKRTLDFTGVYNEYYSIVFSAAYHRTGNVDAAKDVCQEVFTRYFMKMGEVENTRRWLLSALKLVTLEYFRKNGVETAEISDIDDDINFSFVSSFTESRIILEEAFSNMELFGDEKGKSLFDLVAVYHYTYKETAAELGLSERQVKYQYRKTIDRIAEYLRSRGIRSLEDLI